jgi:5-formyltetrahydrofolate cyclo-ligase
MTITEQKRIVRQTMHKKLKQITSDERTEWSHHICTRIQALNRYVQADTILGFIPTVYEPDLTVVYDAALRNGKQVAFPRCASDGSLQFVLVDTRWKSQTQRYALPVEEPGPVYTQIADTSEIHTVLMLIPAVAFTAGGLRLGHGMGYYDRYLARHQVPGEPVGVCFSLQVLDSLPGEVHDRHVHMVITEQGIL